MAAGCSVVRLRPIGEMSIGRRRSGICDVLRRIDGAMNRPSLFRNRGGGEVGCPLVVRMLICLPLERLTVLRT